MHRLLSPTKASHGEFVYTTSCRTSGSVTTLVTSSFRHPLIQSPLASDDVLYLYVLTRLF